MIDDDMPTPPAADAFNEESAAPETTVIFTTQPETTVAASLASWDRIERDDLAVVLSHYDIGVLKSLADYRRGSRRAPKIRLRTTQGEYLLKRRAPGRDDANRVGFTHALQRGLRNAGCPLPELLSTREHAGTMVLHEQRVYELFEYVTGVPFDRSIAATEAAGQTLARVHRAATTWAESSSAVQTHRSVLIRSSYHAAPAVEPTLHQIPAIVSAVEPDLTREDIAADCAALARMYLEASRRVAESGWVTWPKMVIHGDWHPGNLIFRDKSVAGVLDFDSSRLEPRMADVANGALQFSMIMGSQTDVSSWPPQPDVARLRAFVQGYIAGFQRGTPVDSNGGPPAANELAAIPWLMIEALIAETLAPIAAAGSFAGIRGSAFLRMVRQKADWLLPRAAKLVEFLKG